ncbi:unnamed protein product, partial [Polarella glacialis]
MASSLPKRVPSLAQDIDEANLDGSTTFLEAIGNTDGMKLVIFEKPVIVNKPPGDLKIRDLPARLTIGRTSQKKKLQFLDVILNYKEPLDLPTIEDLFLQQRYADMPEPIKMKGGGILPYTMQLFIIPNGEGSVD